MIEITKNEDDGIEVHVTLRDDGQYAVALKDTDCGEFLGSIRIFPATMKAQADAYAATLLGN